MSDNVLAIIPARAGSKRVPEKNLAVIEGQSLVAIAMREATSSGIFSDIILSSDSERILKEADAFSSVQPQLRPLELSTDEATLVDLTAHIIKNSLKKYEYVALLQPTSPFRMSNHIKEAFKLFKENNYSSLVSVKAVTTNPFHVVVKKEDGVVPLIDAPIFNFRTQMTPEIFCLNGCLYFAKVEHFLKNKSFLGENAGVYLMSEQHSLDIDTPEDLELARKISEHK